MGSERLRINDGQDAAVDGMRPTGADAWSVAQVDESVMGSPSEGVVADWRSATERDRQKSWALVGADALAVIATVLVTNSEPTGSVLAHGAFFVIVILAALAVASLTGAYRRDRSTLRPLTTEELPTLAAWSLATSCIVVLTCHAFSGAMPSSAVALGSILLLTLMDAGLRAAARSMWRQVTPPERVVVIGHREAAHRLRRKFSLFPETHAEVTALLGANCRIPLQARDVTDILAGLRDHVSGAHRVVVEESYMAGEAHQLLLAGCAELGLRLSVLTASRELFGSGARLDRIAELPVLHLHIPSQSWLEEGIRRTVDTVISGFVLLVLSPLLIAIAIAIRCDSPGPAIFRQRRAGRHGEPITVFKFRTMVIDAEARLVDLVKIEDLQQPMFKFVNDPRITRLGRHLRRTSMDELPQLINVFRGDMSLVGVRPEQLDLVELYTPEARAIRLAGKPGVTGPMQVFGRGALTFEERLAVERDYVCARSLSLDLRILLLTVGAVVTGRGAH